MRIKNLWGNWLGVVELGLLAVVGVLGLMLLNLWFVGADMNSAFATYSLMVWCLALIAVVIVGVILWFIDFAIAAESFANDLRRRNGSVVYNDNRVYVKQRYFFIHRPGNRHDCYRFNDYTTEAALFESASDAIMHAVNCELTDYEVGFYDE